MAAVEPTSRPQDRHNRRRPFAGWMKRLTNLKSSTSESSNAPTKKNQASTAAKSKKSTGKNNPYPESGHFDRGSNGQLSFSSPVTPQSHQSFTSGEGLGSSNQQRTFAKSTRSTAPTVATNAGTIQSGRSKAETGVSNTIGEGSTFSSPNHSERSLTTTLTTIQSTAPTNAVNGTNVQSMTAPPVQFSHQFPTSPATAVPAHLAPNPPPQTYHTATANNVLTDDASILTLASSSKRRRRNSLDTNASVRALAPSSVWGGSRESLPLSVLSATADTIYNSQNRPGAVGGFASAERASVYSSSGVAAPALSSERNSYYASKQQNADGMSVRSGLLGHGRNDSISGSIGPNPTSPLASPRDPLSVAKVHRPSSDRKETGEDVGEETDVPASPTSIEQPEKSRSGGYS